MTVPWDFWNLRIAVRTHTQTRSTLLLLIHSLILWLCEGDFCIREGQRKQWLDGM